MQQLAREADAREGQAVLPHVAAEMVYSGLQPSPILSNSVTSARQLCRPNADASGRYHRPDRRCLNGGYTMLLLWAL